MHVQEMIRTHPQTREESDDALIRCIEACYDCAQACTACADACLGEAMVKDLVQCIRLNLDCADVCAAAGALASRRSGSQAATLQRMLEVCAEACRLCAAECATHAHMAHCRVCAESCRSCEAACRAAAEALAPTLQ